MRSGPGQQNRRHQVAVLAFHGVVLGDLAVPLEIFGRARGADRELCYDVWICSPEQEVTSEHVTLKVPWRLTRLQRADTIMVPGIDNLGRPIDPRVTRALKAAMGRGVRVASICTGAFVLAASGALNGLRATTHWRAASALARQFPAIRVEPDLLFVDNGRVLTSAGAAAGLDLCLHLVRRDMGSAIAANTARAAVMPLERSGGQAQFIVHQEPDADESLAPLLVWIERNLKKRLSLTSVACQAAMSNRTLSRRFREQVGAAPAQWITKARVRRAQKLLETTRLSIEQVATESGFHSASVLREHFSAILGTSPRAYRQAFGIT